MSDSASSPLFDSNAEDMLASFAPSPLPIDITPYISSLNPLTFLPLPVSIEEINKYCISLSSSSISDVEFARQSIDYFRFSLQWISEFQHFAFLFLIENYGDHSSIDSPSPSLLPSSLLFSSLVKVLFHIIHEYRKHHTTSTTSPSTSSTSMDTDSPSPSLTSIKNDVSSHWKFDRSSLDDTFDITLPDEISLCGIVNITFITANSNVNDNNHGKSSSPSSLISNPHPFSLLLFDEYLFILSCVFYVLLDEIFSSCSTTKGKSISQKERKENKWTDSCLIYGEVAFFALSSVLWNPILKGIMSHCSPSPLQFIDLGSGTGRGVVSALLCDLEHFTQFKGIEILKSLTGEANRIWSEWMGGEEGEGEEKKNQKNIIGKSDLYFSVSKRIKQYFNEEIFKDNQHLNVEMQSNEDGNIHIHCQFPISSPSPFPSPSSSHLPPSLMTFSSGDFLRTDWSSFPFIFINSTVFSDTLMEEIASSPSCVHLPHGALVITLTRRIPSKEFLLLFSSLQMMSWGPSTIHLQWKGTMKEFTQMMRQRQRQGNVMVTEKENDGTLNIKQRNILTKEVNVTPFVRKS